MNMAKSTYYFEINKTDLVAIRNEELLIIIKEIFLVNKGRYGVRRVYMEMLLLPNGAIYQSAMEHYLSLHHKKFLFLIHLLFHIFSEKNLQICFNEGGRLL